MTGLGHMALLLRMGSIWNDNFESSTEIYLQMKNEEINKIIRNEDGYYRPHFLLKEPENAIIRRSVSFGGKLINGIKKYN